MGNPRSGGRVEGGDVPESLECVTSRRVVRSGSCRAMFLVRLAALADSIRFARSHFDPTRSRRSAAFPLTSRLRDRRLPIGRGSWRLARRSPTPPRSTGSSHRPPSGSSASNHHGRGESHVHHDRPTRARGAVARAVTTRRTREKANPRAHGPWPVIHRARYVIPSRGRRRPSWSRWPHARPT